MLHQINAEIAESCIYLVQFLKLTKREQRLLLVMQRLGRLYLHRPAGGIPDAQYYEDGKQQ